MQRPKCICNLKYACVPRHSRVTKGNLSLALEVKLTIKDLQVQRLNILTIRMMPCHLQHHITMS